MDFLMYSRFITAAGVAASLLACVPELDSDEATVRAPRVLAVIADPPEAAERQTVRYRALVADERGAVQGAGLAWFHCLAQKPLAELGPISPDCLNFASGRLAPVGQGDRVETQVPADACSLFGPNPPQPMAGEPPGRPVDADESGGFRLPVVLGVQTAAGTEVALHEQRIACGLAGVSPSLAAEFSRRYHLNENPRVAELRVRRASGEVQPVAEGAPLLAQPGEVLELELAWPACPTTDACGDGVCGPDETTASCAGECQPLRGCGGQERYLDFDRERSELTVRRESLRVSWYATSGSYESERTGVSADDVAGVSRNVWTAPVQASDATLWLVLRDSRGGVGVRQLGVNVR